MVKFSIIIPEYNEAENLAILLPELNEVMKGIDCEFIVVNNASTDNSQQLLEKLKLIIPKLIISTEPVLGYGRAVLTGLKKSTGNYLGIIRSDNQEKPEDLLKLYVFCQENNLHFCKAVRKSRISEGLKRVIISRIYNSLFKILFGIKARDINATPKIFSRDYFNAAHLESKDWFIDAEMVIKAARLGYPISEIVIEYRPRLKGKSSVRTLHILQFLRNMLVWFFIHN